MAIRTRRRSNGRCNARATIKAGALLVALMIVACSVPVGLRAQELARPNGPPTGPVTLPAPPVPEIPRETKDLPAPGADQPPAPPPGVEQQPVQPAITDGPAPPARRFQFTIDPKTPLKDLLPTPPKAKAAVRRGPAEDLASVPELDFQAALAKNATPDEAAQHTAHMLAQIDFLNGKKSDGFLEALRADRRDLDGLPFAMGDACRTKGERNRQFTLAVAVVRQALQTAVAAQDQQTGQPAGDRDRADSFWQQYAALCAQADRGASQIDRTHREAVALARVAALRQVLAPETPDLRMGLVKYLSAVPQAEATRTLAGLAIFSAEAEVRQAAVDAALQIRRERDYTDVLVSGLHYPWPAVASRSAEAAAKLERTDLLPQLVAMLDEPDPRAPGTQKIDNKPALVVRELVRVNHHRNCMLCHSPGDTVGVSTDTLRAPIPLPTEPLGAPSNGYQSSSPDLAVRIDVTYLRQDFSMLQPVEDANPWPEMQRFDFLVRTRVVTDEEAADYREKLAKPEDGRPSPYQRVALTALRELTGKDAAPTAEAWRRVLDLPAGQR